jgi:hypothetical protein
VLREDHLVEQVPPHELRDISKMGFTLSCDVLVAARAPRAAMKPRGLSSRLRGLCVALTAVQVCLDPLTQPFGPDSMRVTNADQNPLTIDLVSRTLMLIGYVWLSPGAPRGNDLPKTQSTTSFVLTYLSTSKPRKLS